MAILKHVIVIVSAVYVPIPYSLRVCSSCICILGLILQRSVEARMNNSAFISGKLELLMLLGEENLF
jgi:hypothetical protein